MPSPDLIALIGAPLDVDQGGGRVVLGDYPLEGSTAAMRNGYALTNLDRPSVFHFCLNVYIGSIRKFCNRRTQLKFGWACK
jgi:hypothetical protein